MIPVLLIDIFLTSFHIRNSIQQAEKLLKSQGEITAQQIASAAEFNLYSGDYSQIQKLLNQTIDPNIIIFSAVYNQEGQVVASTQSKQYELNNIPQYLYYRHDIEAEKELAADVFETSEVDADNKVVGWVHLYISRETLAEQNTEVILESLLFFFIMLIVAILLTLIITPQITKPIFSLLEHLKAVEQGNLGRVITVRSNNEIGDVQKGFNSMTQSLLANRMQLDQKIQTATEDLTNAISDLEYKNRELAIARDIAQNADKVKSQFLANMSHEIRTPINGIQGFASLLSKTKLSSDQQRYTDIIKQSTTDLTAIINEILDFSKIESGNIEIVEEEFQLFDLVESVRNSLFTTALEKNIDFYLTMYSDTPNQLYGDTLRIKQILINLIGNAIKFTDRGYVNVLVFSELNEEDNNLITFSITDTGLGISERDQKSLFKAFKQIETGENRRYKGTGLGLVISQNLAQLMGGNISLSSEPQYGSTFTLQLPLQSSSTYSGESNPQSKLNIMLLSANSLCRSELLALFNRAGYDIEMEIVDQKTDIPSLQHRLYSLSEKLDFIVMDLRHQTHSPYNLLGELIPQTNCRLILMHYDNQLIDKKLRNSFECLSVIITSQYLYNYLETPLQKDELNSSHSSFEENKNNGKNILIVDDNPINLDLAAEMIKLWGHNVITAPNANIAMNIFLTDPFDVILLDIQMPDIDGIELMRMMRNEKPNLSSPIVALTANVMETNQKELLDKGFDAFISKPINEHSLREVIDGNKKVNSQSSPLNTVNEEQTNSTYKKLPLNEKTRDILLQEIPVFIKQLEQQKAKPDLQSLKQIKHKLYGTTCYIDLPGLKFLLQQQENSNINSLDLDSQKKIIEESQQLISELQSIQNQFS